MLHILEKNARTLLNPTGGFLSTFTHSLNAYQGCAFGKATTMGKGCPYCYVREMPIARFAPFQWGDWVTAKINAAEVLRRELQQHQRKGTLAGLRVFMSTATDPYQGIESRLKLTRSLLEVFLEYPIGLLVVQSRSPLIERDLDLFIRMSGFVWISLTIETNDDKARRAITPTSPSIERRLTTLSRLFEAGLRIQAAISPMLPCQPEKFAKLLSPRCTRALVDTFAGDGTDGKRTQALGVPVLLDKLGYGGWPESAPHLELLAALKRELGPDRVVFSQDGFNDF